MMAEEPSSSSSQPASSSSLQALSSSPSLIPDDFSKKSYEDQYLIRSALKRSPFLASLDDEQIERFIEVAELKTYSSGEIVILEGCIDNSKKEDEKEEEKEKEQEQDYNQYYSFEEEEDSFEECAEYFETPSTTKSHGAPSDPSIHHHYQQQTKGRYLEREKENYFDREGKKRHQEQQQHQQQQQNDEEQFELINTPIPPPESGIQSYVYIIRKGQADIWCKKTKTARFGAGNLFGEGGFLFGQQHSASVLASSNNNEQMECWVVDIDTFRRQVLPASQDTSQLFYKYASNNNNNNNDNNNHKESNNDIISSKPPPLHDDVNNNYYMTMEDFIASCMNDNDNNNTNNSNKNNVSEKNQGDNKDNYNNASKYDPLLVSRIANAYSILHNDHNNHQNNYYQNNGNITMMNPAGPNNIDQKKIFLPDFCFFHLFMSRPDPEIDVAFLLMDQRKLGMIGRDDLIRFLELKHDVNNNYNLDHNMKRRTIEEEKNKEPVAATYSPWGGIGSSTSSIMSSCDDMRDCDENDEDYIQGMIHQNIIQSDFMKRYFGGDGQQQRYVRRQQFPQFLLDFQRETGIQTFLYFAGGRRRKPKTTSNNIEEDGTLSSKEFLRVLLMTSRGYRIPNGVFQRITDHIVMTTQDRGDDDDNYRNNNNNHNNNSYNPYRNYNHSNSFSYSDFLAYQEVLMKLPEVCNLVVKACNLKAKREDKKRWRRRNKETTKISQNDFRNIISRSSGGGVSSISRQQTDIIFQIFDLNNDGYISNKDIHDVVNYSGNPSTGPEDGSVIAPSSSSSLPSSPSIAQQQSPTPSSTTQSKPLDNNCYWKQQRGSGLRQDNSNYYYYEEEDDDDFGTKDDNVVAKEMIEKFFVTSVAGVIGVLAMYPLDLVKTRMMNQRTPVGGTTKTATTTTFFVDAVGTSVAGRDNSAAAAASTTSTTTTATKSNMLYRNSLGCFRQTFKSEGLIGLYRGITPQLLCVGPQKFFTLSINGLLRDSLGFNDHEQQQQRRRFHHYGVDDEEEKWAWKGREEDGGRSAGALAEEEINNKNRRRRNYYNSNDGGMDRMNVFLFEALAGGCAGACQLLVTNPIELIKIRLQVQGETLQLLQARGITPLPALQSATAVFKNLGWSGLYKAASVCLIRDIPFSAIYFPTYAALKEEIVEEKKKYFSDGSYHNNTANNGSILRGFFSSLFSVGGGGNNYNDKDDNNKNHNNNYSSSLSACDLLLAGTLAGVPAAFLTTPADVIKTRLQVIPRPGEVRYTGIRDCFLKMYEQEGASSFFKGSTVRVFRIAPQFGITLVAYEMFAEMIGIGGNLYHNNHTTTTTASTSSSSSPSPMMENGVFSWSGLAGLRRGSFLTTPPSPTTATSHCVVGPKEIDRKTNNIDGLLKTLGGSYSLTPHHHYYDSRGATGEKRTN